MKLWAQARIRDLERAALAGRRADAMKDRIVKLAIGARRLVASTRRSSSSRSAPAIVASNEQAETRVVPVNAPAGWAMFKGAAQRSYGTLSRRAAAVRRDGASNGGRGADGRAGHARRASIGRRRRRATWRRRNRRPRVRGGASSSHGHDARMRDDASDGRPLRGSDGVTPLRRARGRAVRRCRWPRCGPSPRSGPRTNPLTAMLERQSASGCGKSPGATPST